MVDILKNNKLNLKQIALLFLIICFHANYIYPQDYIFRSFDTREGLSQPYVYTIIQDAHGFLWAGTGEGLSRFNGYKFRNYTITDSLAENFVTTSICKGDFTWFGHRNGKVSYYDGYKFRYVEYDGGKRSPVTHFALDMDGKLWMSTLEDGIYKIEGDKITGHIILTSDYHGITCFEFTPANELLIGTSTGLIELKQGRNSLSKPEIKMVGTLPSVRIQAIRKMKSGDGFYVATENDGIFNVKSENKTYAAVSIFTGNKSYFTSVQDLIEDNNGNIWLGTFGTGVIKLSSKGQGEEVITLFNKATGFPSDNVKTLYEDNEGNMWTGNYGDGMTQISPRMFHSFMFDTQKYSNNISSLLPDGNYLWFGTDRGLILVDPLTQKCSGKYSKGPILATDTITSLYKSKNNSLWIGTSGHGLYLMNQQGSLRRIPISRGNLENSITSIAGQKGLIWVGTKKGLCCINTITGSNSWYSVSNGKLPHNWVNSLYTDREGTLWVSTNCSIIIIIKDGKASRMPINSVPGTMTLGSVAEDRFSRMWVGTKGNGIYIIDSDSAVSVTTKEGLSSNYCYSMVADSQYMWVGHKGTISRVSISDFSVKQIHHFSEFSEKCQLSPNAAAADEYHRLWFGSDMGAVCYNHSDPVLAPPSLNITSLWINDEQKIPEGNKIVLSAGSYKIRFGFLGISMRDPSMVNYQYMLENYDQWSNITTDTTAIFSHVTDGIYTFTLKASGGDGATTVTPLVFKVVIKKPVWKKWWFYPCSIVLLLLSGYLIIKVRLSRISLEKSILEEKVLHRTMEIQLQKEELELQRDLIALKNDSITSSITYASNIQKAVLPPLEFIEKLLPESFVLSQPKDIVSGDFYWVTRKGKLIIIAVADCTGHGVPGAFMSLLGMTLLNEIVNIHGTISPEKIISSLRDLVVQLLLHDRKDITTRDGMDIGLVVLDTDSMTLKFTGAMHDLVLVNEEGLSIFRADRISVSASEQYKPFTLKESGYSKGNMIYLFSDGYKDQFGGDFDRKYLRSRFHDTLLEISAYPAHIQKQFLESKLREWMKGTPQTDDITVMGVRL